MHQLRGLQPASRWPGEKRRPFNTGPFAALHCVSLSFIFFCPCLSLVCFFNALHTCWRSKATDSVCLKSFSNTSKRPSRTLYLMGFLLTSFAFMTFTLTISWKCSNRNTDIKGQSTCSDVLQKLFYALFLFFILSTYLSMKLSFRPERQPYWDVPFVETFRSHNVCEIVDYQLPHTPSLIRRQLTVCYQSLDVLVFLSLWAAACHVNCMCHCLCCIITQHHFLFSFQIKKAQIESSQLWSVV